MEASWYESIPVVCPADGQSAIDLKNAVKKKFMVVQRFRLNWKATAKFQKAECEEAIRQTKHMTRVLERRVVEVARTRSCS
jgi:hypothetical protein